jgi:TatD DNase family protein
LRPENDKQIAKYIPEVQEKVIKLKKDLQKIFFKAQIELAKKYNLPIIIHNREAKDDVFEVLVETNFKNFIFHCYSEDLEYAKKLLEFAPESMISFSGIVTFKNAKEVQETAKNIPLKNILVETDSPYLTPTPFRGKEENEPAFTKYVLEKIIELREESAKEIEKQVFENSKNIFKIK